MSKDYKDRIAKDDSVDAMRGGAKPSELDRLAAMPKIDEKAKKLSEDLVKICQASFMTYNSKFKYQDPQTLEFKEFDVKNLVGAADLAIELIRGYSMRQRHIGGEST